MTVKELRDKLKEYPDSMPVVIPGYESGFESIVTISDENLHFFLSLPYYEGRYQRNSDSFPEHKTCGTVYAVTIQR